MKRNCKIGIVAGVTTAVTIGWYLMQLYDKVRPANCDFQSQFPEGFFDVWKETENWVRDKFGMNKLEYSCDEYYNQHITSRQANTTSGEYDRGRGWGRVSQVATVLASFGLPTLWYLRCREPKAETTQIEKYKEETLDDLTIDGEMTYHNL
jgi:hypothetical protein